MLSRTDAGVVRLFFSGCHAASSSAASHGRRPLTSIGDPDSTRRLTIDADFVSDDHFNVGVVFGSASAEQAFDVTEVKMTCSVALSELAFGPSTDEPVQVEKQEEEAWTVPPDEKDELLAMMSAPLLRAIDAWTRRISEGLLPPGAEREDLEDRISEEAWLLSCHGYRAWVSYGPYDHRGASFYMSSAILPPRFAYDVYSLDDLADPGPLAPTRTFPATGGRQPGEFDKARDLADELGGAVILKRTRWIREYDADDVESGECDGHDRCVYVSDKMTPAAAYEAFMQQYDDGFVISRFLAVFEHMRKREHRNVEAITERKPADHQRLGEIAFYLDEVRSWKADRDWLLDQGKI
jgi:hypothetical protein